MNPARIPFAEQPVKDRIAALRGLLEHLEWVIAAPGASATLAARRWTEADGIRREIARLQDYEDKGLMFEPDF